MYAVIVWSWEKKNFQAFIIIAPKLYVVEEKAHFSSLSFPLKLHLIPLSYTL